MVKVFEVVVDRQEVYPGDQITGHVVVETKPRERVKARAVRVRLHGKEFVRITRQRGNETVVYKQTHSIVDEQVTLFGIPKEGTGDPVFLEPDKKYSFPFKFHLPATCLPTCEYSNNKSIRYGVKANIDIPWWADNNCATTLMVLPNCDVGCPPSPLLKGSFLTTVSRQSTPTSCCCIGHGELGVAVEVGKDAHWWQDEVHAKVSLDNTLCRKPMRDVVVALSVSSTYCAKGHRDTHKHVVAEKQPELPNGQLREGQQNVQLDVVFRKEDFKFDERFPTCTVAGEIITHSFNLEVRPKYGTFFGNCGVDLPMYIADGPGRPTIGAQGVSHAPNPFVQASIGSRPEDKPNQYDSVSSKPDSGIPVDQGPVDYDEMPMFGGKEEYGADRDQYRTRK